MIDPGLRRTADEDPCALARLMFERVLTRWAMDVLSLRRHGLDRPGHREIGPGLVAAPGDGFDPAPAWDHAAY